MVVISYYNVTLCHQDDQTPLLRRHSHNVSFQANYSALGSSFLAQLQGAMSTYTMHYGFSMPSLVWINDPLLVMLLIYSLILITYGISKFDMYMHDLYQIGMVMRNRAMGGVSLSTV